MRYITHSKYRNWSKCDVRRILNCDIYRIYFLNAMYVASACGVLQGVKGVKPGWAVAAGRHMRPLVKPAYCRTSLAPCPVLKEAFIS